jgi:voltage-gated potassium channel Kch
LFAFFLTLARLLRGVLHGLRDPEFRALFTLAGALLLTGTLFYRGVEGWSILDSLYFSVATLTTVGYGDLAPTTPGSKVFTIVYILVGVGVLVGFAGTLASHILEAREQDRGRLSLRRAAPESDKKEGAATTS